MNRSKLIRGGVAAGVVSFLLSGLWHVLLMGNFYESATAGMREPSIFWSIGLGYLVLGFIMAYMFPKMYTKGYEGHAPLGEGLKFGAIIGLLWWLPTNLVLYGVTESPFSLVIVDSAWHVVEEALGGAALGLVSGPQVERGG